MAYKDKQMDIDHSRQYYETHKENVKATHKLYRDTHKKERYEYNKHWRATHQERVRQYGKIFYQKHQQKQIASSQRYANARRIAVLTYYGNGKCACVNCGIDDIRVLSIDHINGGGTKHRKELGILSGSHIQWRQGEKRPAYKTYANIMELISKEPNKPYYDNVDINLISHSRHFEKLPKTGRELISEKYHSKPYEVRND